MKTTKRLLMLLLFSGLVFTSCSKNNEEVEEQEQLSEVVMKDFQEKVSKMSVPNSMQNSNNAYAQQANVQFQSLKTIAQSYSALFTVPANATASRVSAKSSNSSKTYTWSANGFTVKYTVTESSDRYTFSYNIEGNGVSEKLMDGYQLKDGSYAEAKLYDSGITVSTIKWWINGDIAKLEVIVDTNRIILESNTINNSGNIKVYESSSITLEYNWNSDGSGWVKNYLTNETFTW